MIILKTCFKHSEDICRNKEALNLTSTICDPSLTLRELQVGLWRSLPSSNNFLKRPSDEFLALEKLAKNINISNLRRSSWKFIIYRTGESQS